MVAAATPYGLRAGPAPVALVTADTESHVAVVSLQSRRVVKRIATSEGPRSIQSLGDMAVVAHAATGVVTLLEGRRVRRVLHGFQEPRYTAYGRRHAFVTDSGSGEVAVIDLARGRVVRRLEVGALARHVSIDPAQRRLWVPLGSSAAEIVEVDVSEPEHPRVTRRIRPPFLAHDVGFAPFGGSIWVTAGRERTMAVYRGARHVVLAADEAPQHVTFGPTRAYIASGEGRSVRVHALNDGRMLRSTRVPIGSYNVQRGAGAVLTPSLNAGILTVLDGAGRVRFQTRVASAAHDCCVIR